MYLPYLFNSFRDCPAELCKPPVSPVGMPGVLFMISASTLYFFPNYKKVPFTQAQCKNGIAPWMRRSRPTERRPDFPKNLRQRATRAPPSSDLYFDFTFGFDLCSGVGFNSSFLLMPVPVRAVLSAVGVHVYDGFKSNCPTEKNNRYPVVFFVFSKVKFFLLSSPRPVIFPKPPKPPPVDSLLHISEYREKEAATRKGLSSAPGQAISASSPAQPSDIPRA